LPVTISSMSAGSAGGKLLTMRLLEMWFARKQG